MITWFETDGHIIQLIIFCISIAIAIIITYPKLLMWLNLQKFLRLSVNKDPTEKSVAQGPDSTVSAPESSSRLLDLSLVLICAAFYSILIIEALIISGSRTNPFLAAPFSFLVTLMITCALVMLWNRRKGELGIGIFAIMSLLLLILAPGGPFISGDAGTPSGIDLWLPVLSLVLLAGTMVMYVIGYPLDRTASIANRRWSTAILILLVGISVFALGRRYQNSVLNNPRTPDIASREVYDLLRDIRRLDTRQVTLLYQVFSDVIILETYSRAHRSIASVLEQSDSNPYGNLPTAIRNFLIDYSLKDSSEYGYWIEQISPFVINGSSQNEVIDFLSNEWGFFKSGLTEDQIAKGVSRMFGMATAPSLPSIQKLRYDRIISNFEELQPSDQISYLATRLNHVHPIREGSVHLGLPDISPVRRLERLSDRRIANALRRQPEIDQFIEQFEYSDEIERRFGDGGKGHESTTVNIFQWDVLADPNLRDLTTPGTELGDLEKRYFVERLLEQISLPLEYEAALTYEQYLHTALGKLSREFIDSGKKDNWEDKFDTYLAAILDLDPDIREAFLQYFVNSENRDDFFKAVKLLAQANIDFCGAAEEGDECVINDSNGFVALKCLVPLINDTTLPPICDAEVIGPEIHEIGREIRTKIATGSSQAADNAELITTLFDGESIIPVYRLLHPSVLEAVQLMSPGNVTTEMALRFFQTIGDPISEVAPQLAASTIRNQVLNEAKNNSQTANNSEQIEKTVEDFIKLIIPVLNDFFELDATQKVGLLNQLAVDLYQPDTSVSLDVFSLMIAQSSARQQFAGLLVAAFFLSPFVFAVIVAASYGARRLTVRDRLRNLMLTEAAYRGGGQFMLGLPNESQGRNSVIDKLKKLAGRGWSSIAVVGRRGVGKTRVLFELMRTHRGDDKNPSAVTVWLSAPSKFDEAEFIESVLERLTTSVESVIGQSLGAKPIEVRRLETNYTFVAMGIYIAILFAFAGTYSLMSSARLENTLFAGTWFPVIIVLAASTVSLVIHLTTMQPVDLSPWLERDRSGSPHAVLLYREALKAREFLNGRRRSQRNTFTFTQFVNYVRITAMLVLTIIGTIYLIFAFQDPRELLTYLQILIPIAIMVIALAFIRGRRITVVSGQSLMSLVAEYREFAERTVYRIRQGALGERIEDDFEVVICIDELDKIVELDELRVFLRRMKAIFEIPGIYYYLSLSEDALRALILGVAEGKNEIDSAFDHIVKIPPLNINIGTQIAEEYLRRHTDHEAVPKVARTIAAVSFGVPRDIIRRSDEILADQELDEFMPNFISDDFRRRQAELAYTDKLLTKREFVLFADDAKIAATELSSTMENGIGDGRSMQIMLSLWVLSLVSLTAMQDDEAGDDLMERLRDVGYRITDESASILVDELQRIQQQVMVMAQ